MRTAGRLPWTPALGLSVALSLAALDVGLSLLPRAPARFADPRELLVPLAASSLIFVGVTMIWIPLVRAVARWIRRDLDLDAIAAASAVFLAAALSLASLMQVAPPFRPRDAVPLGVIALVGGFAAVGSYKLLVVAQPPVRRSRLLGGLLLALPLLLLQALILIWFSTYRVPRVASLQWLAGLSVFGLVAAATIWSAVRFPRRTPATITNGILLLSITAGAVITVHAKTARVDTPEASAGRTKIRNIFLITVDTLRADQLLGRDGQRPRTPNLDRLADSSVVFRNAVSEASWTLPALATIMSGLPVAIHGATDHESAFPDQIPTLAEYLAETGYSTAAIGRNPYLRRAFGLSRGFSTYLCFPLDGWGESLGAKAIQNQLPRQTWNTVLVTTEDLTTFAIDLVRQHAATPLFLWLHYLDPHLPYSPTEPPDSPESAFNEVSAGDLHRIRGGIWAPSRDEQQHIKALYQAEVEDVDRSLGRFLEALRELDLFSDSLIVFTSDHGEELFEHGGFEHGHSLYDELLRVPLMIKLPGQTDRREDSTLASTRAIMPTLLELIGIDPREKGHLLPNLLDLEADSAPVLGDSRPVFLGGSLYYGARQGVMFRGLKYVRNSVMGHEELYDLRLDPHETRNLADSRPELIRDAQLLMQEHLVEAAVVRSRLGIESERADLSDDITERLRALGYLR